MKFSIATPCFNSRTDLPRCVGSIRGQLCQNADKLKTEMLKGEGGQGAEGGRGECEGAKVGKCEGGDGISIEHLIQDGGSTDGTVAMLEAWMETGNRGQVSGNRRQGTEVGEADSRHLTPDSFPGRYASSFVSGADKGMYDAINKAWERSTGDVLSWLNADEQYLPGTLETVARYFAEHPECDAVFGNAWIVDGEGNPLAARREIPLRKTYVTNGFLYALSCTLFYRRALWDKGWLRLDSQYRYSSDADLVLRLLENGVKFGHMDRFLSVFGVAGGNLSFSPAMKEESEGIKRKFGMLRSPWARRVVMGGRHLEKLFRGCYCPVAAAYPFALDEVPNYREVAVPSVGTRFEYGWYRPAGG